MKFPLRGTRKDGEASSPLPGRYKGKRRTWRGRVERVRAECGFCPWRSKLLSPQKADKAWVRHMALQHAEGK